MDSKPGDCNSSTVDGRPDDHLGLDIGSGLPVYISMADRTGSKKDPEGVAQRVPFRLSPVILWLGIVSMASPFLPKR
jgi:hypothetical protein